MDVALFFSYGVSLQTWCKSGLYEREIELYKELTRQGIRVTLFTYGDKTDHQIQGLPSGIRLLPFYERVRPSKSKIIRACQSLLFPWFFRNELKGIDVYKTNQIWGGWVAVLAKWMFKKPLVLRGGYEPVTFAKLSGSTKTRQLIYKYVCYLIYRNGNVVQMATEQDANTIHKLFGVTRDRIETVPNWINTEIFQPVSVTQKESNAILVVGRLDWQKNLDLLFKALKNTGIRIDLIGEGAEKSGLEQLAKKLHLNARFFGTVKNYDLPEYYSRYSVYVICSRFEGLPKTVLEAMACGIPVVGTNVTGIRNLIEHERNGLLCEENENSLRNAIQRLIDSPDLREKVTREARAQIVNNHSLHNRITAEIKTYNLMVLLSSRH